MRKDGKRRVRANDADKLFDMIEELVSKSVSRKTVKLKLGTVKSVSGGSASVIIDGDSSATPAAVFCAGVSANKRVIVTTSATQYYVIGVRQ